MTLTPDHKDRIRVCMVSLTGQISETGQKRVMTGQVQNPIVLYTLRRPIMHEVLSTIIWGVPPAGGPLL